MNSGAPKFSKPSRKYFQLGALLSAYVLSNLFRTLPAILAPGISQEFALSIQSVGYISVAFNFSFGGMQLFVGVAIDRFGPERTTGWLLTMATIGSLLSCFATSFPLILVGQALIGIGCSAVFLGSLVFVSRHFPAEQFTALSGLILGVGGLGMLISGTPLAFVADTWSWRTVFIVVSIATILSNVACLILMNKPHAPAAVRDTVLVSFSSFPSILRRRGTAGILVLGCVGYAAILTFRGFWIVPFLSEQHGLTLVQSGNVALLMSIGMTFSPFLFGRIDPGGKGRRYLLVACTLALSMAMVCLGIFHTEQLPATLIAIAIVGGISGFTILQYADVRSAYEPHVIGRAMSLLNLALFMGAAIGQVVASVIADAAISAGANPFTWVFLSLGLFALLGAIAYCLLPTPPKLIERASVKVK